MFPASIEQEQRAAFEVPRVQRDVRQISGLLRPLDQQNLHQETGVNEGDEQTGLHKQQQQQQQQQHRSVSNAFAGVGEC